MFLNTREILETRGTFQLKWKQNKWNKKLPGLLGKSTPRAAAFGGREDKNEMDSPAPSPTPSTDGFVGVTGHPVPSSCPPAHHGDTAPRHQVITPTTHHKSRIGSSKRLQNVPNPNSFFWALTSFEQTKKLSRNPPP